MKNIDVKNKANISCSGILEETCLKLDCCGIEVGSWYEYCPKCGKKIDIEKCKNEKSSHVLACMNCLIMLHGFVRVAMAMNDMNIATVRYAVKNELKATNALLKIFNNAIDICGRFCKLLEN